MTNLTIKDDMKLRKCHPDLVAVIEEAAKNSKIDFMVMETTRSVEQQKQNVKKGVSSTMRSRHLPSVDGKSRAADLVPIDEKGDPIWAWPVYFKLADVMKAAAKKLKIPVEWGGDWKKFKDGPHWQLPWKEYP